MRRFIRKRTREEGLYQTIGPTRDFPGLLLCTNQMAPLFTFNMADYSAGLLDKYYSLSLTIGIRFGRPLL